MFFSYIFFPLYFIIFITFFQHLNLCWSNPIKHIDNIHHQHSNHNNNNNQNEQQQQQQQEKIEKNDNLTESESILNIFDTNWRPQFLLSDHNNKLDIQINQPQQQQQQQQSPPTTTTNLQQQQQQQFLPDLSLSLEPPNSLSLLSGQPEFSMLNYPTSPQSSSSLSLLSQTLPLFSPTTYSLDEFQTFGLPTLSDLSNDWSKFENNNNNRPNNDCADSKRISNQQPIESNRPCLSSSNGNRGNHDDNNKSIKSNEPLSSSNIEQCDDKENNDDNDYYDPNGDDDDNYDPNNNDQNDDQNEQQEQPEEEEEDTEHPDDDNPLPYDPFEYLNRHRKSIQSNEKINNDGSQNYIEELPESSSSSSSPANDLEKIDENDNKDKDDQDSINVKDNPVDSSQSDNEPNDGDSNANETSESPSTNEKEQESEPESESETDQDPEDIRDDFDNQFDTKTATKNEPRGDESDGEDESPSDSSSSSLSNPENPENQEDDDRDDDDDDDDDRDESIPIPVIEKKIPQKLQQHHRIKRNIAFWKPILNELKSSESIQSNFINHPSNQQSLSSTMSMDINDHSPMKEFDDEIHYHSKPYPHYHTYYRERRKSKHNDVDDHPSEMQQTVPYTNVDNGENDDYRYHRQRQPYYQPSRYRKTRTKQKSQYPYHTLPFVYTNLDDYNDHNGDHHNNGDLESINRSPSPSLWSWSDFSNPLNENEFYDPQSFRMNHFYPLSSNDFDSHSFMGDPYLYQPSLAPPSPPPPLSTQYLPASVSFGDPFDDYQSNRSPDYHHHNHDHDHHNHDHHNHDHHNHDYHNHDHHNHHHNNHDHNSPPENYRNNNENENNDNDDNSTPLPDSHEIDHENPSLDNQYNDPSNNDNGNNNNNNNGDDDDDEPETIVTSEQTDLEFDDNDPRQDVNYNNNNVPLLNYRKIIHYNNNNNGKQQQQHWKPNKNKVKRIKNIGFRQRNL
ncbi:uncharacterized protein LOC142645638 [Dermatophagoides pteronyssinus]|uniref:uncharacterized protein LOC142645638 n=1 Tax=Dermatophagoides pteronyssinus TaxID=6956 RepID=UPI003F682013